MCLCERMGMGMDTHNSSSSKGGSSVHKPSAHNAPLLQLERLAPLLRVLERLQPAHSALRPALPVLDEGTRVQVVSVRIVEAVGIRLPSDPALLGIPTTAQHTRIERLPSRRARSVLVREIQSLKRTMKM